MGATRRLKLDEFLARLQRAGFGKNQKRASSPWLDFCGFLVSGKKVHVVDASYAAVEEEGCIIPLARGNYQVRVKLRLFEEDWRIARFRVVRAGAKSALGSLLGHVGIDTARVVVYDYDTIARAWRDKDHESWNILNTSMHWSRTHGVTILDAKSEAVVVFARSGFGDGTYSVRELKAGNVRVGFDVIFITPSMKYPFSE